MPRRRNYLKYFFKVRLKRKSFGSLIGLSFILAAGILLLSLLGVSEPVKLIYEQISKLFGFISPLLIIAFAITGLFLLRVRPTLINANTTAGFYIFLLSTLTLSAIFSSARGGVVGRFIADMLSSLLSTPGAIFVLLVLILVSIVIFFNTSLEATFEFSGRFLSAASAYLKNHWSRSGEEKEKEKQEPLFATRGMEGEKGAQKEETLTAIPSEPVTNLPGDQAWEYPPLEILTDSIGAKAARGDVKQNAATIEQTLESFGIQAKVVEVNMGPAVTQYALEIALGTKLTKITSLANDIALALAASTGTVRIEAPIPGKSLVGIEVPNITPEIVPLKSILASQGIQKAKSKLGLALGLDVSGQPVIDDLGRMPHILMAGSTGSGKSVAINSFIATLLFRATPSEVKLILVDPKIVELSNWKGTPHLLTEVINDAEKVISALRWAISEMNKRYKLFAEVGARNIDMYNEISGFQALPYIVIIIDELADIMLFAPVEVEDAITRLAQMSRAVGIHMVLATQRPSVDVITGLIKANIPCRMTFNVTSQVDSRVIIDQVGAEKLLGRGDMLYVPPDASKPRRIQGAFVSEPEINKLIEFLKKSGVEPQYTEEITAMPVTRMAGRTDGEDELFEEAVKVITQYDRASASLLQRRLRIGYARAARLIDQLETAGVVGAAEGSKPRDVLVKDPARILGESNPNESE
ncbi:MAG TPA: DNA translocase FtsK 4TM domain-containing protein [Candidatus Nanoarchaeia archaeon]